MASANNSDDGRWGTIFMGPTADRESTLDKLTDKKQRELWTQRTESEYLARVRVKATVRVEAMLKHARIQADELREGTRQWSLDQRSKIQTIRDHTQSELDAASAFREEAELLREQAHEQGYQHGVEQAMAELEEHRAQLDVTTAAVLQAIQSQNAPLFEAWREDMIQLLRRAIETGTGWVLTEERRAVIDALLVQSMQLLEDRRRLIVHAHPEDVGAVEECLVSAKARFSEIRGWDILPDAELTPGGLIVESASGKVDNSIDVRRATVEEVLQHLTLEAGNPERLAEAAIQKAMEDAGVPQLAADGTTILEHLEAPHQETLPATPNEQALEEPLLAPLDLAAFEPVFPDPEPAVPEPASPEPASPEPASPEPASPELALPELALSEQVLADPDLLLQDQATPDIADEITPESDLGAAPVLDPLPEPASELALDPTLVPQPEDSPEDPDDDLTVLEVLVPDAQSATLGQDAQSATLGQDAQDATAAQNDRAVGGV